MTESPSPSSSRLPETAEVDPAELELGDTSAAADSVDGDAPAVVAVLVATKIRDTLNETLQSLAAQDYPNFSVLVVDAAEGEGLADQVAEVLPSAFIHRVTGAPGFAAAANQSLSLISGAAFLLLCHDDVALDARCASALVEEIYRSNAGIVSPKVVRWDDRRRLQQIGRTSDRFGVQVDLVEPDEFDQEQYDSVRDVFVAPSGVQLVRADLFTALGGFDQGIPSNGEDLDLCWRAHVAGARVLAVPAARARHLDDHSERGTPDDQRCQLGKHRLRTLLVVSSRSTLIKYLPIAVLLLLVEALYCLVSGRRKQAAGALKAISWNASRLQEVRERRKQVAASRKVSDREVHALQVAGSARISQFFSKSFGARQDRITSMVGSVRESLGDSESTVARDGIMLGLLTALILVFGSRNLNSEGLVGVGSMPIVPSASSLWSEWLGGWRSAGLGGQGNAPIVFAAFGLLRTLLFFSPRLLDWTLLFGPLVVGSVGMFRLLRPFGSVRASSLAMLAYALNPVVVLAYSGGRWDALVLYSLCPTLLGSLLRLQGIAPFGERYGSAGEGVITRDLATSLLRLGLCATVMGAFAPATIPIAVLVTIAILIGSVLVARPSGTVRLLLGVCVIVIAPVALQGPFAVDVLRSFSWDWFIGAPSASTSFDSLADLARFAPNGNPRLLGAGLVLAAAVSILIAKGRRFDVAVVGWSIALTCWLALWAERRDLIDVALPAPEVLLVPAAAGMALAVGIGARAVEVDLRTQRYGWRQMVVVAGTVCLAGYSLVGLSNTASGRWDYPTHDFRSFTSQLEGQVEGPTRVLWLAHPSIAPLDTQQTSMGTYFAVTNGAEPTVLNQWVPDGYGATSAIAERLDLAATGETVRLGRLLGHYGIDYIVVLDRLAPAPFEGVIIAPDADPETGIVATLADQLDLVRLTGMPNFVAYRNTAAAGPAVALPGLQDVEVDPSAQLRTDVGAGQRLDLTFEPGGHWSGTNIETDELWLGVDREGWKSNTEDVTLSETANGTLRVRSESGDIGQVDLVFEGSGYRKLALLGQILLLVAAALLAQTRRQES